MASCIESSFGMGKNDHSPELNFSDLEEEESTLDTGGNYASRMEEIMGDGDEEESLFNLHDHTDDEDDFLYTGIDSDAATIQGYSNRLREVLEQDASDIEDEVVANSIPKVVVREDEQPQTGSSRLTHKSSTSSLAPSAFIRTLAPIPRKASNIAKPFLQPTISRLRSHTAYDGTPGQNSSISTSLLNFYSPSPSHFSSSLSRMSSFSNSSKEKERDHLEVVDAVIRTVGRSAFKWTHLHSITQEVYKKSKKAMSILGSQIFETPTVLAANGFVCIGTTDGKILVYDFGQNLKCICGDESSENRVGAVTALSLSHDHTCVAAGYSTGDIQIYNLQNPTIPMRTVPPTSLAAVYSGRKEGHIIGSRIVSIGFVAGRHTAIVSADVHGLAFYHSLGKVLFVEASDILRILGRYPDPPKNPIHPKELQAHALRHRNPRYTILAMAPLPLGTTPHETDKYNIVAMLTPTKLVVVGLKPSPKTWFKVARGSEEGGAWRSQTKWKGAIAWYPSVLQEPKANNGSLSKSSARIDGNGKEMLVPTTAPMLAFSWGNALRLVSIKEVLIKQVLKNAKTGKEREVEVGAIDYQSVLFWTSKEEILGIQWLNSHQLVILMLNQMGVYDLQSSSLIEQVDFDATSLMSPTLGQTKNLSVRYQDAVREVSHSMRIYKGRIFLLGRDEVLVGTLLTWADRILSLVEDGDFLSAIELARSYYLDEAPGNRNGLPTDLRARKDVIGDKLRDLMAASARYAFSEDRMSDSTHVTPDGRGVDRTALFESLTTTCCYACIALDDMEFLFEDLFQKYDDSGIASIYLRNLEPFMLNNEIRYVPPRITQRLISLYATDGRTDLVERVIWHIDPACLDINQAIHLCQKYHLYDALIYVYTRALRDYVAPIVELLSLIRRVLIHRRIKSENAECELDGTDENDTDSSLEPIILNSYKVYPYLSHVLSGLTYPSGEPLPEEEAFQAKEDVYTFLFYGRSSVWPPGEGGKLVLTSDEEGGMEPTYPYVRQLLQWDAESFLHSLDIAFEDTYLNDETQTINRLIIVRILSELVASDSLSSEDKMFVHIFMAKNVPKYFHQYLQVAPSELHKILVYLTTNGDLESREDRQLATEYLLSVYSPHDSENIVPLFEKAGFYRILRSWYRRDRDWNSLFMTYLKDQDMTSVNAFENMDEVLKVATQYHNGILPSQLSATVENSLERLLEIGLPETALTLQKHLPNLHDRVLDILGPEADEKRFAYLQALLSPTSSNNTTPSPKLDISPTIRRTFLDLQCRFSPHDVVSVLESLPADFLQWDDIIHLCENNNVHDAVIWAHNAQGEPQAALDKAVEYQRKVALDVVETFKTSGSIVTIMEQAVKSLSMIGQRGIDVCLRQSVKSSDMEVPLEDIWFTLLNSQINVVQLVSSCKSDPQDAGIKDTCLSELRSLVQNTFGALVSITSTSAVSFPRLFKRLANSTTATVNSHYDEFRTILTGMLESYRSDGDILTMTKQLVERDLFETMARLTREKSRGWMTERGVCVRCRKPLTQNHFGQRLDSSNEAEFSVLQVIIARTGKGYHSQCYMD